MQIKLSLALGALFLASSTIAAPMAEPGIISDAKDKLHDVTDKVHNVTDEVKDKIGDLIPQDLKDEFKGIAAKAFHLISELKTDLGDMVNVTAVPITDAMPGYDVDSYTNGSSAKWNVYNDDGEKTDITPLGDFTARNPNATDSAPAPKPKAADPKDDDDDDTCDDEEEEQQHEKKGAHVEKRGKKPIDIFLRMFKKPKKGPDHGPGAPAKKIPEAKLSGSTGRRKDTSHPTGHCGWPMKSYPKNWGGGTDGEMFCIIPGGVCRSCKKGVHPEFHACKC